MRNIYLIGFMGSGKSSVAKELSIQLDLPTRDTDTLIEETYKQTIPEIFEKFGEETFRDYESEILINTTKSGQVIATGGGIIEKEQNRKWLKENGIVIYLQTTWDEIVDRLKDDQLRPIWNNTQRDKKKLLDSREDKYIDTASFIVKTDNKEPKEIANEIIQLIR